MAIIDMLLEGSRVRGHTYLLWEQLQERALQYLKSTGPLLTLVPLKPLPFLRFCLFASFLFDKRHACKKVSRKKQ